MPIFVPQFVAIGQVRSFVTEHSIHRQLEDERTPSWNETEELDNGDSVVGTNRRTRLPHEIDIRRHWRKIKRRLIQIKT